jgi:hypothetical protein
MPTLQLGREAAARQFDRIVNQIGQLLVKEKVDEGCAVAEFLGRQRSAFRNIVPILEAGPASGRGGVLGVVDRVTLDWRLATVTRRLGDSEVFAEAVACGVLQRDAAFVLGMAQRALDGAMEEMVAD